MPVSFFAIEMTSTKSTLFILTLLPRTYAYTEFKPDCPLPPSGTNYVAGPNVRSSLTILWNCLSVILLCTWNIQHLNIPVRRENAEDFVKKHEKKKIWWRILQRKVYWWILDQATPVKWTVITVFAPEILVGKAFCEWRSSIDISKQDRGGQRWQVLQDPIGVHLANMGYFVLDWSAKSDPTPEADLELTDPEKINESRLKSRFWALSARQWDILHFVQQDLVDFPNIQELQLEKLGQRGLLVKVLTFLQVNYLVIQLICRKAGGLPSTQLEITALAFAFCSTITYALYWNRPQGVQATHIIKAKKLIDGPALQYLIKSVVRSGPTYIWTSQRFRFRSSDFDPKSIIGPKPIPNDSNTAIKSTWKWIHSVTSGNQELGAVVFGALAGGTIFGGLHCLAWNFHFPTPGEALGWRICSVATTALPILSLFPTVIWIKLNPSKGLEELEEERKPLPQEVPERLERLELLLQEVHERLERLEQLKPFEQFRQFKQAGLQNRQEWLEQLERFKRRMRYIQHLRKERWGERLGKLEQDGWLGKLGREGQEWLEWLKGLERPVQEARERLKEFEQEARKRLDLLKYLARIKELNQEVREGLEQEALQRLQRLQRLEQEQKEQGERLKRERFEQKELEELEEWEWRERFESVVREEHPEQDSRNKKPVWSKVAVAFICVEGFLVPYILARLFLLVEVFRTLCFLPPDAFVDTWSGSFPHIG